MASRSIRRSSIGMRAVLTNILRAFDFDLDLTLDEISSAGEVVGRAELKAALANGRLAVDPATVWFGQGKFSADFAIDVRGKIAAILHEVRGNRISNMAP